MNKTLQIASGRLAKALLLIGAAAVMASPAMAAKMMKTSFLDPQMSWPFTLSDHQGQDGKFYINGQNEGYTTVFDADSGKKLKTINMWEYERAALKKAGKKVDEKANDFIMKNMRPHHGWVVPGGRYYYVSNNSKESSRMWVVDTKTDEIVGTFEAGGKGPLHGAFSPFQNLAAFGAVQDKKKGVVTLIDTKTHKVIGEAKTSGVQVRDIVFTPDNKHLYATNQGWDPEKGIKGKVDMINIKTRKIVKTFDIPGAKGMKMTYDGKIAGVTNFRKGEVVFIDAVKHKIIGTVKTGGKPNNVSFTADNKLAFAGLYEANEFVIIDLKKMSVAARIAGGKEANAVYPVPGSDSIAIGTSESDDFVTFIDYKAMKKIKDIPTPLGAHNVSYTPDGKKAIVSCKKSREAVILDVAAMDELEIIPDAGNGNNGVRWVPYAKGLSASKPY